MEDIQEACASCVAKSSPRKKVISKRKANHVLLSMEILFDFVKGKIKLKDMISNCVKGKIQVEFRSILWRIFLNILPCNNIQSWEDILKQNREMYYKKVTNFCPNEMLRFVNDDLARGSTEYDEFTDRFPQKFVDIITLIKLDVDRTFQEIDLFRNPQIKETLCKILFVWSLENIDLGYCQGMNEIVGTLCYALYPSNIMMNNNSSQDEKAYYYYLVNSEEHFEADLYTIFAELMSRDMKSLYGYNNKKYAGNCLDEFEQIEKPMLTLGDIQNSSESELKKRINTIFFIYMKIVDKELFLNIYDRVEPYIFLLRWILCILTREISLNSIIYIWDCILAFEFVDFEKTNTTTTSENRQRLNFLDHIIVAMICSLKDTALAEEDGCILLSQLMHFPNERNINDIVNHAVKIREKLNYFFHGGNSA